MYHSPKLFKDPESFVPERWTGDARYAKDVRSAVQPFSVGVRDCLGKKYGCNCPICQEYVLTTIQHGIPRDAIDPRQSPVQLRS
jgi:cytochrome P450